MSTPLIAKIEIRSFRSVYEAQLESCKPLNILVGGNDSGKSNILRALNLFFNGETDLQTYHDWRTDYSIASDFEQNKRHHKKEIEVIITFNNVFNYKSLPKQFQLKKAWDREVERPEPVFITKEGEKVPPKAMLTRFLKQITVYYIPAIKDKETFAHCLEHIHDALSEKDTEFSKLFENLQKSINKATSILSNRIQQALAINSHIVFPANLKEIFGDLDFTTQSQGDYERVSLHQRGDGVQARHIPHILDFISRESEKRKFIWLYEEPENSLELRRAFDLAQAFKNDFSKRNQIFLTTHSPAFYSLDADNISRYQIIKGNKNINGKKTGSADSSTENFSMSEITKLDNLKDIDESLGLTALVANRAKEAYDQLELLTKEVDRFKKQTKPLILCEGKTDVMYIEAALRLFNKNDIIDKCKIMEICQDGKGSGCKNLINIYSQYEKSPQLFSNHVLLVFDCDVTGKQKETDKVSIFTFKKQENSPFKVGIENALSLDVAQELERNKRFWETTEQDKGHKK